MSLVHRPADLDDALEMLASLGDDAAPLAGGTWIMRGPVRREPLRRDYIMLNGLSEMSGIEMHEGVVRIGALATHADIGEIEAGTGPLGALAEAARRSAFPAVRNVATLGGNIAAPFPEADLVPPLLAAGAVLEVASSQNRERVDVVAYLEGSRPTGELIVAAHVPAPTGRRSWFERLTVRAGAEYPLVTVAVSLDLAHDGAVAAARIAVGSVHDRVTRVPAAESALGGRSLDSATIEAAGAAAAEGLMGRDGLEAPGWYRVAVLPTLVRRALARLRGGEER